MQQGASPEDAKTEEVDSDDCKISILEDIEPEEESLVS